VAKNQGDIILSLTDNVPANVLRDMYITMLRIRRMEEKIVKLYPEQEMRCPTHLYIGQEAIATGVCANLQKEDYVFGTYRGHGHYLAKGGNMKKLAAELYGKATGCAKGKGGSMHIVAPEVNFMGCSALVGGGMPMAAGAALAAAMQHTKQVSVSFIGDGVVEEGVFHETLNFASLRKLPVIFICENNLYAVHVHQSARQPGDNIYERAACYLMPGMRIDGNDVIEVYRTAKEAIQRARAGDGPTLIECRTYRWFEHVGPNFDWDLGYRTKEEGEEWMAKCPLKRFRKLLQENGLLSDTEHNKLTTQIDEEVEEAFQFAKNSPFPDVNELELDVYAD
jgi:pyruvate dehydrogenase E1 component alpha subunit